MESASAPLSGSSSIQNLASGGGVGGTSGGVGSGASHSASICLSNVCLGTSSFPSMGPRSANSCTGSLRGSLRIHPSSTFQSDPSPTAADGGPSVVEPGGQMNNISPCSFPAGGDATTAAAARQTSSQRPKPPQSPMDFESSGAASSMNLGLVVSMSKSEYSLPTPSTRAHRGSHSNSFSAAPGVGTFQPSYVPPPPPLDTQSGALYVARLREEVTRLRALVAANQSDQLARAGTYEREERLAAEENLRLRRLLQAEMDRKEALSRQLSGSESSLEMEDESNFIADNSTKVERWREHFKHLLNFDTQSTTLALLCSGLLSLSNLCGVMQPLVKEKQFNEASRTCQQRGRFRTTSDSLPSPYHPAALFGPGGSLYGPGHAFASAVAAANCGSHSGSPRYCRECNQPIPSLSVNAAAGGVTQQPSRTTVAGNVQQLSRPAGTPSAPQVSNSLSIGGGGSERFAKPVSRPAHSHSTSSCCTTPPGAPMVVRSPYRCGDKGPPRTFDPSKETPPGGAEEDDDFGDDEDDRCPTPPGSSSVSALK
ncbi:unnamed protein product [Schistocephalus solidus]|uniref:Uncharacterized protein n=1 Tax=Schistocephalus solidus TaxID=70667 RepID=A0A3P7C3E1_SCHSO|nr:unnamed protein product [Schistocephalus solidus]